MSIDGTEHRGGYERVNLRDGAAATLRRLGPDDADAVVALAESLTGEEKYLRFFTTHPGYLPQWATSLTDSALTSVAIGAFDHGELVGVANYTPPAGVRQSRSRGRGGARRARPRDRHRTADAARRHRRARRPTPSCRGRARREPRHAAGDQRLAGAGDVAPRRRGFRRGTHTGGQGPDVTSQSPRLIGTAE